MTLTLYVRGDDHETNTICEGRGDDHETNTICEGR